MAKIFNNLEGWNVEMNVCYTESVIHSKNHLQWQHFGDLYLQYLVSVNNAAIDGQEQVLYDAGEYWRGTVMSVDISVNLYVTYLKFLRVNLLLSMYTMITLWSTTMARMDQDSLSSSGMLPSFLCLWRKIVVQEEANVDVSNSSEIVMNQPKFSFLLT